MTSRSEALLAERVEGVDYDHRSGIAHMEDHLGRKVVLVHVRVVTPKAKGAGVTVYWRPDIREWARDTADRLESLPGDFTDRLEGVLGRLMGPGDRFL